MNTNYLKAKNKKFIGGMLRRQSGFLLTGLVLFTFNLASTNIIAQNIKTFAGNGLMGYAGDNGPANLASFTMAPGVTLDASGNVYITQQISPAIRKVDAITNVITTIAGNGTTGYSGDGFAATNAQLNDPLAMAFDGSGNLYFSDAANNVIRMIDGAGIIHTVAGNYSLGAGYSGDGGQATAAQLNLPFTLLFDAGYNNLYIADQENFCVRKMDMITGIITTVAGTGTFSGFSGDGFAATSATMTVPAGLAFDGSGNLFIADQFNHVIRMVDPTGIISTPYGTPLTPGFAGDGGPASAAEFNYPTGITMDGSGNLFVADQANNRVREIDGTGTVSTYAGNGAASYTGDWGPATAASFRGPVTSAFDVSGNLYVTAWGDHVVREIGTFPGIPPVLPSTSDNTWYLSANPIQGLNTASIAYGPSMGTGTIFASSYYDGTLTSKIYVTDPAIGTVSIPVGHMGGVPDLIIGNSTAGSSICPTCNPSKNYILADAFRNNTGKVEINFYNIFDNGVALSVTALPGTIILPGFAPQVVHIDVIQDISNTGLTGWPFCNKFVVTWDDYTMGISFPRVFASYGNLATGTLTATSILTPPGMYGYAPDVAAIQRYNPYPTTDDIGLITFVDVSGNRLYYSEWDVPMGTTLGPQVLDGGATSSVIAAPRIDAFDDPSFNSSPMIAKYEVAAQVTNLSGNNDVRTYNNLLTPLSCTSSDIVDISGVPGYSAYTPPYNNYSPAVAVGSFNYQNYDVTHFTEYAAASDILFLEPININVPGTVFGSTYYWVNSSSGTPTDASGCNYANSVSTPANYISLNSLYAWAFNNGSSYEVDYKLSGYPYAFKHNPAPVATEAKAHDWKIYPNPAANTMVIDNAITNDAANSYRIMDMVGKVVMQGTLVAGSQSIDVSRLNAGNYILGMFRDESSKGTQIFVKN